MKQVNIVEGQVVQVVEFIWDERHPNTGVTFIDAPDEVEQGWTYSNGIFTAPPPRKLKTEEEHQADLAEIAEIATREAEEQQTEVERLEARLAELQGD